MKLLLHICCAPCSVKCIESLRDEGAEPTGYWYNFNIHLLKEYVIENTLTDYAREIKMKLICENEYGLRKFIEKNIPRF